MTSQLRWLAVVGDGLVILLFALIGRSAHADRAASPVPATIAVALPFLLGWYCVGRRLYRLEVVAPVALIVGRVGMAWAAADGVALTVRSLAERRLAPVSFVVVSLVFGWLMLAAWRLCLLVIARRGTLPA